MISILPASMSKLGVKIKNETTGQIVFADFKNLEVNIDLSSEFMRHTKEDGNVFVDSKIVQPFEVEITGFLASVMDLRCVAAILVDRSHYYSVTVNGLPWNNMLAVDLSLDSDAETLSTYPVQMVFRQILARQVDYVKMDQGADYPNRKFGDVGLGKVSMTVQQLFDKIKGMI